jgi:hypothetical protein
MLLSPRPHTRNAYRLLIAVAVVATSVTASTAAAGSLPPAEPTTSQAMTHREQMVAELDRSGPRLRATAEDSSDAANRWSAFAYQEIFDPLGDAVDPRGDIYRAAIDMDANQVTTLGLETWVGFNPNGWLDLEGSHWDIDVNGDGQTDFFAAILNGNSGVQAAVARIQNGNYIGIVCDAARTWNAVADVYIMWFPTSCIGNPQSVRWRAAMNWEGTYDFAPNSGWAGPATNSAYQPPAAPAPAPIPPPPAPAPIAPAPPAAPLPPGTGPVRTVNPTRAFDSRVAAGQRPAGSITEIPITSLSQVPNDAVGAVLNVTALDATAPGYLTVFPCGTGAPDASNVNYTTGQTVPNTAISRLGNGRVCVFTSAATGLIVDVTGFLPASSDIVVQTPARFYDTRNVGGPAGAGSVTEIQIAARGGAPANLSGAILNVTALDATAPGYLTVFPCGTPIPDASNVNYTTGQTVPNAVISRVGSNGAVCVFTSATSGLIVDVAGFIPTGSGLAGINPARLLDTRATGAAGPGSVTEVQVTGRAGIPAAATTVVLNLTALEATEPGYLTVFPCGQAIPDASNVNYTTSQTVPNAVVARIGSGGRVCVFTSAATGLIVDASGWSP